MKERKVWAPAPVIPKVIHLSSKLNETNFIIGTKKKDAKVPWSMTTEVNGNEWPHPVAANIEWIG